MTRPLDIALVGCGRLAEVGYLPALAAAEGVHLVAVADPDEARRARVAELAGAAGGGRPVPAFAETSALIDQGGVDALVLASPAAAHVADARLAASARLAVLVEKPPAPDEAGAAELAALRPAPWVGFNRRFDPGTKALRRAVLPLEGDLEVEIEVHYRRRSWRPLQVADDALADLGPHLVDLAQWVTGREVTSMIGVRLDATSFELELDLGRGRAVLRGATDQPYREHVAVRSDGVPVAAHRRGGLAAGVLDRLTPWRPHPLVASLTAQLEAFAAAVRGDPAPTLATAADGQGVMAILDAARRRSPSPAEQGRSPSTSERREVAATPDPRAQASAASLSARPPRIGERSEPIQGLAGRNGDERRRRRLLAFGRAQLAGTSEARLS